MGPDYGLIAKSKLVLKSETALCIYRRVAFKSRSNTFFCLITMACPCKSQLTGFALTSLYPPGTSFWNTPFASYFELAAFIFATFSEP